MDYFSSPVIFCELSLEFKTDEFLVADSVEFSDVKSKFNLCAKNEGSNFHTFFFTLIPFTIDHELSIQLCKAIRFRQGFQDHSTLIEKLEV